MRRAVQALEGQGRWESGGGRTGPHTHTHTHTHKHTHTHTHNTQHTPSASHTHTHTHAQSLCSTLYFTLCTSLSVCLSGLTLMRQNELQSHLHTLCVSHTLFFPSSPHHPTTHGNSSTHP